MLKSEIGAVHLFTACNTAPIQKTFAKQVFWLGPTFSEKSPQQKKNRGKGGIKYEVYSGYGVVNRQPNRDQLQHRRLWQNTGPNMFPDNAPTKMHTAFVNKDLEAIQPDLIRDMQLVWWNSNVNT